MCDDYLVWVGPDLGLCIQVGDLGVHKEVLTSLEVYIYEEISPETCFIVPAHFQRVLGTLVGINLPLHGCIMIRLVVHFEPWKVSGRGGGGALDLIPLCCGGCGQGLLLFMKGNFVGSFTP